MAQSDFDPKLIIEHNAIKLVERIGTGTFGEVWKGTWGTESVAVKKVNIQGVKSELVAKLYVQLKTLVTTVHPRLLQYYGICLLPEEIWLVMELDDGSISSIVSRKVIPMQTKWEWFMEAASALTFLHHNNIPHGAIKSSNFNVVKGQLKTSDYGLASAHQIRTATNAPLPLSTVRALAPESVGDNPVVDAKSDVFSLGMVLWEIAEGDVPYSKLTEVTQVITAICDETQRPAMTSIEILANIIKQCWQAQPANRPTALDVLTMITSNIPHIPRGSLQEHQSKIGHGGVTLLPPASINIISIVPPQDEHQLVSRIYSIRLYNRVSEYFTRFYVPTDPNLKATLDKVEVICNPMLDKQFARESELFASMYNGLVELRGAKQKKLQQTYLRELLISKNLMLGHNGNPISAWHGTAESQFESICWYGLLNLSSEDPGYFGKGIYLTQMPSYGEYYANKFKFEQGKASLLLCWALVGRPWAVTQVQLASGVMPDHTSHYVLVKKKKLDKREQCKTLADFELLEGVNSYLPVEEGELPEGDEIVVFKGEHVLPRFIVHYTVSPKTGTVGASKQQSSSAPVEVHPVQEMQSSPKQSNTQQSSTQQPTQQSSTQQSSTQQSSTQQASIPQASIQQSSIQQETQPNIASDQGTVPISSVSQPPLESTVRKAAAAEKKTFVFGKKK